ncbi:uncharacterized protein LOC113513013 [Galleria mellonella]|uniref:Uncharacterized protein LOC113513013 n=1 Tax=Galleria mellonella TaxID=7137 RepID=A0ABM3MH50_GALME|nr:uncharacterized protein LOC113513013 [Galleria mellonella]
MSVPIVKKCCCCVSLRTATLVIGCLYTIWTLAELIGSCVLVTLLPIGTDGKVSIHKRVLYITAVVVCCVHLLFSVLLIVAVIKKLPVLMLPWTIVTGIISATVFVMSLMGMSLVLQDWGDMSVVDATFVIIHFLRACISAYCIVVVHSYHKDMMNKQIRGTMYNKVNTEDTREHNTRETADTPHV